MNILVVCQYYYPEPFRIHEVCESLVERGHNVTVLTGLPNYPMGVIPDEYKGKEHRDEIVNGVHILRVSEIPRTQGKVGLAKNYVSFAFNGSLKALTMKKNFDVIFVYQLSPVLMAIPAYVAKWFSRTKKLVIYCLDLWPESLVSMGIGKSGIFFRFMKFVSKRIYKGAKRIGYTSEMFRQYFTDELNVENDFYYIPQFADELFSRVEEKDDKAKNGGECSKKERTINYVFAGNIGKMQSVDTIIKAAVLVKNKNICWHIVGDGSEYEECIRLAKELEADDKITFHGRMPVEKMPEFYEMADAMIVTLADSKTISYTLPGKVQSYMAAGKAVLASANGETAKVIEKAECGLCCEAENAEALADIADRMAEQDLHVLGNNAREYYNANFSKKSHIDQIEKMLTV